MQFVNEFYESSVGRRLSSSEALSSSDAEEDLEPATDLWFLPRSSLSRFRNLMIVCSTLL